MPNHAKCVSSAEGWPWGWPAPSSADISEGCRVPPGAEGPEGEAASAQGSLALEGIAGSSLAKGSGAREVGKRVLGCGEGREETRGL